MSDYPDPLRMLLFRDVLNCESAKREDIDWRSLGKIAPNLGRAVLELIEKPGEVEDATLGSVIILLHGPPQVGPEEWKRRLAQLQEAGIDTSASTGKGFHFIDPGHPEKGLLFMVFPMRVSQIPLIKALPWVKHLELPDMVQAEIPK